MKADALLDRLRRRRKKRSTAAIRSAARRSGRESRTRSLSVHCATSCSSSLATASSLSISRRRSVSKERPARTCSTPWCAPANFSQGGNEPEAALTEVNVSDCFEGEGAAGLWELWIMASGSAYCWSSVLLPPNRRTWQSTLSSWRSSSTISITVTTSSPKTIPRGGSFCLPPPRFRTRVGTVARLVGVASRMPCSLLHPWRQRGARSVEEHFHKGPAEPAVSPLLNRAAVDRQLTQCVHVLLLHRVRKGSVVQAARGLLPIRYHIHDELLQRSAFRGVLPVFRDDQEG